MGDRILNEVSRQQLLIEINRVLFIDILFQKLRRFNR